MDRVKLYKDLYCAARSATEAYWQKDAERVKELRDMVCTQLFNKHYTEMDEKEILYVIEELNTKSTPNRKKYASPKQKRMVQLYAIPCAIYYCDLEGLKYRNKVNGEIYTGKQLREYLQQCFDRKTGIPNNILNQLYIRWINPKSHKFLEQSGFRNPAKKPERFFYEYLSPDEAKHLINRYREILSNIHYPYNGKILEEEARKN